MKTIKQLVLAVSSAIIGLTTAVTQVMAQPQVKITVGKGYANDFGTMFSSMLNIVMLIAALLVFAYMIWGGIEWITSGGDKSKAESARNKLTAAIIGLVIVAASYAVVTLLVQFLGFSSFQNVFDNMGTINGAK